MQLPLLLEVLVGHLVVVLHHLASLRGRGAGASGAPQSKQVTAGGTASVGAAGRHLATGRRNSTASLGPAHSWRPRQTALPEGKLALSGPRPMTWTRCRCWLGARCEHASLPHAVLLRARLMSDRREAVMRHPDMRGPRAC